jgi:hypothetical protein
MEGFAGFADDDKSRILGGFAMVAGEPSSLQRLIEWAVGKPLFWPACLLRKNH